jgi:hypothetical protein
MGKDVLVVWCSVSGVCEVCISNSRSRVLLGNHPCTFTQCSHMGGAVIELLVLLQPLAILVLNVWHASHMRSSMQCVLLFSTAAAYR